MINNPFNNGGPQPFRSYGGYQGFPQGFQGYGQGQQGSQTMHPPGPGGAYIGQPPGGGAPQPGAPQGILPIEQSYIENILRLNLGKTGTFYMTYENNSEWNAKIFRGRIEAAGRDHIIISDPKTGMRFLLLMVNLDYVTFDEELQYTYPFAPTPR
ncbi:MULTISPECIES: spore coat protein GerQ [Paenibacillus]|uniref:Spore coat protein GerQ n=1 Tax=Paenibacillus vulneris TaxID=1133364 RepID=A0ABW3UQ48_9BACL|nr:spore germination protein Q [Paenibacillus sp. OAS669]